MRIKGPIVKCPKWTNLDWRKYVEQVKHRTGVPITRDPKETIK
jgi:hypothetical protein